MLPDLLKENLLLVICGTAVGKTSAKNRCYYADRRNEFWNILYKVGLTPIKLCPERYHELLDYGIGLVDLVKRKAGSDKDLSTNDFDIHGFKQKIKRYHPKIVCFNGKKSAKIVLRKRRVEYGYQKEQIGNSRLFVAPSTSGAARRYFHIKWWQELANDIKKYRQMLNI
jgi:TDG/mug DNA glycosylase family protein